MTATSTAEQDIADPPVPTVVDERSGYWGTVGKRLSRDTSTLVCAGILLLILLAIVFAPLPHAATIPSSAALHSG